MVGLDIGQRKTDWVVEVKWSGRFFERPADLKTVLAFAAANRLSRPPLITTRTQKAASTSTASSSGSCPPACIATPSAETCCDRCIEGEQP